MSSSKINTVIGFKIQNLMDLSTLEGICARKNAHFSIANSTSELPNSEKSQRTLIVCDLSSLMTEEIQTIGKIGRDFGIQTLGFYPHIAQGVRVTAQDSGFDLLVPRSAFRAKLESLLS